MQGKIVKGIAGFYYVHVAGRGLFECKAKGVFRNQKIKPLVGDDVEIEVVDGDSFLGNIVDILPRKSEIIRPAVANVDQSLLVFALSEPEPNLGLLDRFIVMMAQYGLKTIICFNKLDESDERFVDDLKKIYEKSGCRVLFTSTKTLEGLDEVRGLLKGKTTALAGPSGVGKSSLLNVIIPEAQMETGCISEKIGRGKHTTRHSEVFVVDEDTYILDTPGFTSLSVMVEDKTKLRFYMDEFEDYEGTCKFNGCVHINEPGCSVKDAVDKGLINRVRYNHYVEMYNEIDSRKKKY